MLLDNIVPSINSLLLEEECYFQQDGAPSHYHNDVRNFLSVHFPGRWIGHTGRAKHLPQSPVLTPLHFYLWGTLKNNVYAEKPRTLQDLRHKIETACAAIPLQTIQEVCHSVACSHQRCTDADSECSEHLRH
jgi:hypothetical protein